MSYKHPQMSRRSFCLCCAAATTFAATGAYLTPRQSFAKARGIVESIKESAAKSPIVTHRLRGGVSVLEGSGGNIAVLTGREGKLLIDCGISVSQPQIAKALAALGPAPVTHLIDTHWHFDHADGNAWVQSTGATIIAHENTRKRLLEAQRVEDWSYTFEAPPASALPSETFSDAKTLSLHGATIALKYYGPAHTDSDISVTFGEADILHAADTFWNGVYPFIDYSTGGSIDGTIRAAEANLAMTTNKTLVISGHGQPVGDRSDLMTFRDMLVDVREAVATLKRQGRPLADIVAANPSARYDAKWGHFAIDPALFTKTIYEGV